MAAALEKRIEFYEPVTEQEPQKQRRRQVQVNEERRLGKGQSILLLTVVIALMASLAAATIQLTVVQGAEVRGLEKEIAGLKIRKSQLQMEVDQLRAVSRIESEALAMGMEKPIGTVYVASALPSIIDIQNATQQVPKTIAPPIPETKSVIMDKIKVYAKMFTSFFASTQR